MDYDSLLTHPPFSPVETNEFYIAGEHLPDMSVAGELRHIPVSDDPWLVSAAFAILILMAFYVCRNYHYIGYRIRDFFTNERRFTNANKPPTVYELPHIYLLTAIGAASLTFLFHEQLSPYLNGATRRLSDAPMPFYVLLFVGLHLFFLCKSLLYALVNWVFFDRASNRKWMSAYFFLGVLFSCMIFVVAFLYLFMQIAFQKVAFCMLILLISYKILLFYKLFSNFKTKKYGVLLIFLYFCSVEIAPVVSSWHFLHLSDMN